MKNKNSRWQIGALLIVLFAGTALGQKRVEVLHPDPSRVYDPMAIEVFPNLTLYSPLDFYEIHDYSFDRSMLGNAMAELGVEPPVPDELLSFSYLLQNIGSTAIGVYLSQNTQLLVGLQRFSIRAVNDGMVPGRWTPTPVHSESYFKGNLFDMAFRQYLIPPGPVRPFAGIGVLWQYLVTEETFLQVGRQQMMVDDAYDASKWAGYLSGGVRFFIGPGHLIDIEARGVNRWYELGEEKSFTLTHQLGARYAVRF